MIEKRCPLRIKPGVIAGCCCWATFLEGLADAWPNWFDTPPTPQQWQMAKRDWKSGNTGWEAAHNAQRRVKERSIKFAGVKRVGLNAGLYDEQTRNN